MAAWVTAKAPPILFDPAVGPGTFFAAARSVGYTGALAGFELHAGARGERDAGKLGEPDFEQVSRGDFLGARYRAPLPGDHCKPAIHPAPAANGKGEERVARRGRAVVRISAGRLGRGCICISC